MSELESSPMPENIKDEITVDASQESSLLESVTGLIMRHRKKIAAAGVIVMGCLSGLANTDKGIDAMQNAAVNQMIHTAISATVIMQVHAVIAKHCKTKISQILPAMIPAAISIVACYAIHKLGIPNWRESSANPELSTVPTVIALSVVMPTYHFAYFRDRARSLLGRSETGE